MVDSLKSGAPLKNPTQDSSGKARAADIEARNNRPKWLTFTPLVNSAIMFLIHGGQSDSSAPTRAIASLALLAIRLRTMPTGSARRMASSRSMFFIFSSASCSMCCFIRSRSNLANLAEDEYCCSLNSFTFPALT